MLEKLQHGLWPLILLFLTHCGSPFSANGTGIDDAGSSGQAGANQSSGGSASDSSSGSQAVGGFAADYAGSASAGTHSAGESSGGNANLAGRSSMGGAGPAECLAGFESDQRFGTCINHPETGCKILLACYREKDCSPDECGAIPNSPCYGTGFQDNRLAQEAYKENCK